MPNLGINKVLCVFFPVICRCSLDILAPPFERGNPEVKKENCFQSELIKEIKNDMPGCFVLKNDGSNTPQGFPDLLILYKDKWGSLECKRDSTYLHSDSAKQANQDYYVGLLNEMSFSRFISPENKEEVLDELYSTFGLGRSARVSRRK